MLGAADQRVGAASVEFRRLGSIKPGIKIDRIDQRIHSLSGIADGLKMNACLSFQGELCVDQIQQGPYRPYRLVQIVGQCMRENLKRASLLGDTALHSAVQNSNLNHVNQCLRIDVRFADVVLRALQHGGDGNLFVAEAGQYHDRNEGMFDADAFENFKTIATGEGIIEQHAGKSLFIDACKSILATGRFGDRATEIRAFFQRTLVKQPIIFAVIDDQNLRRINHSRLLWATAQFQTSRP